MRENVCFITILFKAFINTIPFTCSINGEHNRQVVAKIIKDFPTTKVKYTSDQIRGIMI